MEGVSKTFDPVGRLQLFAFEKIQSGTCAYCDKEKKSKKWAVLDGDWDIRFCNGCYGQVLAVEPPPFADVPSGLKKGLYRLTKSMENPFCGQITHRDLMGVLRVFPAGWDWLVHRNESLMRNTYPPISALMVTAACGNQCQDMYVYESEHKKAMEDWDEEDNDTSPLLAPREFLQALVPREPDTFTRIKQLFKESGRLELAEVIHRLVDQEHVQMPDLLEAVSYAVAHRDERLPREDNEDEKLYSDAVNEVFNETGEHWID